MTGIGGFIHFDGRPAQQEDVQRLIRAGQTDRPRPVSVSVDGCVGLVQWHASAGPRHSAGISHVSARRAGLRAVGVARIDRRDELIRKLGVRVDASGWACDVLLIALAYEKWGKSCLQHIDGAFAFALWDERRLQLFCARDRVGLRPFYYARTDSFFAFASEVRTLRALPGVVRGINEDRVADFLMQATDDRDATFHKNIFRLPPAHWLVVSPGGTRLQPYWKLDREREIRLESDEAYAQTFRDLFVGAVRDRIGESSSLGSLLSGGLDSSAVTCAARTLMGADDAVPLKTFSAVFDDVPQSDERRHIHRVFDVGGLRPHFIRGDRIDPFEDLDLMLAHVEEPFITPNLYLHWHLWKRAREEGVSVMLDGFLGDNVVSHGSRYLTELASRGRWLRLAREIRNVAQRHGRDRRAAWHIFKQFVLVPLAFEPAIRIRNRIVAAGDPLPVGAQFVQRDLLEHVRRRPRAGAVAYAPRRTPMSVREEHFDDLTGGILPTALETAHKSASAFGVEPRFPFADRGLIEFCLSIPPTQKYSRGMTRVVARRAMKNIIPDAVLARHDKADLGPSFARSLLVTGGPELREHVFELLPTAASYLDVEALQSAYLHAAKSPPSHRALIPIWRAVVFARWLKLDREGHAERGPVPGWAPADFGSKDTLSGRIHSHETIHA